MTHIGGKALWLVLGGLVLSACATGAVQNSSRKRDASPPPEEVYDEEDYFDFLDNNSAIKPPRQPDFTLSDASAFAPGDRPKDGGSTKKEAGAKDGGADAPSVDAGPCTADWAPGDLVVTEFMVQTQSGSGDKGEWVEFSHTRSCAANLKGIRIESPRGAGVDVLEITEDLVLPGGGRFVVADTSDAAKNGALPGLVLTWANLPADTLKNEGDSIKVLYSGVTIDSVTYPKTAWEPKRSLSFPSDCSPSDRADWSRWSLSYFEWNPGSKGTPNATNDDVSCF